ncbi:MAG: SDR family NAD(P)-dependent oxidoreductase [Syntrophales bacterium]
MKMFDLSGKVALVTGGSKGLGKATVVALSEAGADTVVVSRHLSESEAVVSEAECLGRKSIAVEADVQDQSSVTAMVEKAIGHFGKIDILVNNAGVNWLKPVLEFTVDDWKSMLSVNLIGCYLCAQAVGKYMIKQKTGNIINIASMLETVVLPKRSLYAATKAAVVQLTKYLAVELAEHGIRSNAICPGPIETPLLRGLMKEGKGYEFIQRIPIQRLGRAQEIGGTVVYLASEASAWVTGTTIYVDGGYSAL